VAPAKPRRGRPRREGPGRFPDCEVVA